MSLELTHPKYLFGLLLAIVLFWAFRYSLIDFSKTQRWISLAIRLAILTLIVLSLAGLTLMSPSNQRMIVFLLDQSRSIDAEAAEKSRQFLADAQAASGRTPLLVIPFASTPETPLSVSTLLEQFRFQEFEKTENNEAVEKNSEMAGIEKPNEEPLGFDALSEDLRAAEMEQAAQAEQKQHHLAWRGETNIEAALEPALALIPPNFVPHLVLLSDGNETSGDVLTAALKAGSRIGTGTALSPGLGRIPISTVALPASEKPEVQLAEIRLPGQVRQGEPFYLDIVVQSNIATEADITLYRGPFKVAEERKSLKQGENVFRFKQTVEDQRQQEFSATIDAKDDTILDNNRASGLLFAGGKPRILIVESEPRSARDLVSALREQDITAEIRPAEGMPRTLDELDNFEAIILSNVPATSLSLHQMDLIRTYLSDLGGGLIMLGGEQSFGLGGYYKTPIEEVLPVRSDFEKEKEKPSLAMCLVIDRSGSMGGQKMELAKDAAKSAVELLTSKDFASVIAFDHASYIVCPMQSAASTGMINSAISTIEAAGGTNIYPALVDAHDQLRRASAKLKHVILLTDGQSTPGDYEGIVRQMVSDQITVSTVGVGDADNELLRMIAENGKGRHYSCDDPQAIPQIFAKETMTASKSAINEMPFVPVIVTPTEVLADVDIETAPPLLGFVVTRPKPTCQFILATETGEPLLVWWRYGLGMSVAFTSDAKSRWGAEWLTWPEYSKFWAQVIRQAMRQAGADQRGSMVEIIRHSGGAHLTLDLVDQSDRYVNEANGQTTIIRPDLSKEEIVLKPTAPGRYETDISLPKRGGYHLQSTLSNGEKVLLSQSRGLMVGYPDELRLRPTNNELLEQLARSTGGMVDPKPEELFVPDVQHSAWRATPLWPWLLSAAALLFVFDVLLRRIDFGRPKTLRRFSAKSR